MVSDVVYCILYILYIVYSDTVVYTVYSDSGNSTLLREGRRSVVDSPHPV